MRRIRVLSESVFKPSGEGKVVYAEPYKGSIYEEKPLRWSGEEKFPYRFLNPIQTVFYRFYKGGNALISAPTSAGKTGVALLFFRNRKGRLVYAAPTKALVSEKAKELKSVFGKVDVRTGDVIEEFKPVSSRVVVATYENLALALRNKAPWTEDIEAVVVDEVHSLMGSRGQVVEEVITALLKEGIDLLALSATVPGAERLASWLKADLFIESDWRPVPLERRIIPLKEFKDWTDAAKLEERGNDVKMALKLLSAAFELSERDEKVIVFVPKKSVGWLMLEIANLERLEIANRTTPFEVKKGGWEIAFHNADVPKEEREEIEKRFREGNLNFLIATQTLAYGVNLPADKVFIGVRAFFDRFERRLVVIPDTLDILQEEGRAGRFGIKEKGFSYILPYGSRPEKIKNELEKSLEGDFEPFLSKELKGENSEKILRTLTLFLLAALLHGGEDYKSFLRESFSLREFEKSPLLEDVIEWLKSRDYVDTKLRPSEKGLFCLKSGVPPVNFEEFLRRKDLALPLEAVVRPLLYTKRFDSLYTFLRRNKRFPEDRERVLSGLALCGNGCLKDNTDQLLFFVLGYTFRYPNISNPPGEFSYLGSDALHLMRTLLELRRLGLFNLTNAEILRLAHSLKYGLEGDFAPLGGIKGVGHVRANLLKEFLKTEKVRPPTFGERLGEYLSQVEDLHEETLTTLLVELRNLEEAKAEREVKTLKGILRRNRNSLLVDDRILRTFGLFLYGRDSLREKRESLLRRILG